MSTTTSAMKFSTITSAFLLSFLFAKATSHGLMVDPPQRGNLSPRSKFHVGASYPKAPADFKAHFPAGDKSSAPGAAIRSQIVAAGPAGWTPFLPTRKSFRWRAGVCGDQVGKPQDHLRGGRFYFDGKITKTYKQGQVIQSSVNIVAHHNGFIELYVCDVAKCGGEISEGCYKKGHCYQLMRAPNPMCDSGFSKRCAPIDPDHPERWYLPCSNVPENTFEFFGGDAMLYLLPKSLTCDHCVLSWFWTAANTCNPPGVIEFFEGDHGPKNWGQCPGQGGAKGGYTKVQRPCGSTPTKFPEEYHQCADIRIEAAVKNGSEVKDEEEGENEKGTEEKDDEKTTGKGGESKATKSAFQSLDLIADGRTIQPLADGAIVSINDFKKVTIEARTYSRDVKGVMFFLNGKRVWAERAHRYFLFGNKGDIVDYWKNPIVNRYFVVKAVAGDGSSIERRVMLKRN